jgi:hypothetical protein
MERILIKKCFLFTVGSVYRVKRFTTELRNCHVGGKSFADEEEVETEMRKCLREQSKDFYVAGFEALVKRWDKWRICLEINVCFSGSCPFVTHLLTLHNSFAKYFEPVQSILTPHILYVFQRRYQLTTWS